MSIATQAAKTKPVTKRKKHEKSLLEMKVELKPPEKLRLPYRIWRFVEKVKRSARLREFLKLVGKRSVAYTLSPEELEKFQKVLELIASEYEQALRRRLLGAGAEVFKALEEEVRKYLEGLEQFVKSRLSEFDEEARRYYVELFKRLSAELQKRLGVTGSEIAKAVAASLAEKIKEFAEKYGKEAAKQLIDYLTKIAEQTVTELQRSGAKSVTEYMQKVMNELIKRSEKVIENIKTNVESTLRQIETHVQRKLVELRGKAINYYEELYRKLAERLTSELGETGRKVAQAVAATLAKRIEQYAEKLGSKTAEELVNYLADVAYKTVSELKRRGAREITQFTNEVLKRCVETAEKTLSNIEKRVDKTLKQLEVYVNRKLAQLDVKARKYYEVLYRKLVGQLQSDLGEAGAKIAQYIAADIAEKLEKVSRKYGEEAVKRIIETIEQTAREVVEKTIESSRKLIKTNIIGYAQHLRNEILCKVMNTIRITPSVMITIGKPTRALGVGWGSKTEHIDRLTAAVLNALRRREKISAFRNLKWYVNLYNVALKSRNFDELLMSQGVTPEVMGDLVELLLAGMSGKVEKYVKPPVPDVGIREEYPVWFVVRNASTRKAYLILLGWSRYYVFEVPYNWKVRFGWGMNVHFWQSPRGLVPTDVEKGKLVKVFTNPRDFLTFLSRIAGYDFRKYLNMLQKLATTRQTVVYA